MYDELADKFEKKASILRRSAVQRAACMLVQEVMEASGLQETRSWKVSVEEPNPYARRDADKWRVKVSLIARYEHRLTYEQVLACPDVSISYGASIRGEWMKRKRFKDVVVIASFHADADIPEEDIEQLRWLGHVHEECETYSSKRTSIVCGA